MSKLFITGWYGDDDLRVLYEMSYLRAPLFALTSRAFAEYFKLPMPMDAQDCADSYVVDEEAFCQLVEKVYQYQSSMCYEWFVTGGAQIYEVFKGHRIHWKWERFPRVPMLISRYSGYSPDGLAVEFKACSKDA